MAISVDKAVIAKLVKGGEKFEILVDPVNALDLKSGKEVSKDDLLASDEVFEDVKKGLRSSPDLLNKTFGTNDILEIAKKIIKQGDVQITAEQRKEMMENLRKKIAATISRKGINPQTDTPHPPERILRAMDEAKVKIDIAKKADEQVDSTLKAITPIIPIRFEKLQLAFKIPAQFAGKASGVMRNLGKVVKEEWKSDGSYICLLEIPAGLQNDVFDKLNSLTHGQIESKIVKRINI
jgi:ribosome maturation protein SDO1